MKYYIGNIEADPNFLEHYGIAGMKWGRRNGPPYPLGSEQKSKVEIRKEYRADKKEAFVRGRDATVADRALAYSMKKLQKASKSGNQVRIYKENEIAKKAIDYQDKTYKALREHHEAMIKKYGAMNVSDYPRNKKGQMADRVVVGMDFVKAFIQPIGKISMALLFKQPLSKPVFKAISPNARGRELYRTYRKEVTGK